MSLGAGADSSVGFAVLGNPVRLKFVLCAPKPAPDLLAIAGVRHPARDVESVHVHHSFLPAIPAGNSWGFKAVEAKAAWPSCSIVVAHAIDPRTRIRYTPVHPAPALIDSPWSMSSAGLIPYHPTAASRCTLVHWFVAAVVEFYNPSYRIVNNLSYWMGEKKARNVRAASCGGVIARQPTCR